MDSSRLPFPSSQRIFFVQLFRMFETRSILADAPARSRPGRLGEG